MKVHWKKLLVGCSLASILITGGLCSSHPFWNWDLLPYMAGAAELDGLDPVPAHDLAYSEAQKQLPAGDYQPLVDPGNPYRLAMRTDPTAFHDQLPFYWVKPLYIAATWLFWKLGVPLAWASICPSFLGFMIVGLVLIAWAARLAPAFPSAPLIALFMALPVVREAAGLSSPDALSAAVVLSGAFLLTTTRWRLWGAIALVLSIAVRMDNMILVVTLLLTQPWWARERTPRVREVIAGVLASAAMYFVVKSISCAHGWCVGPEHSFMPRSLHPQNEHAPITTELYLNTLRKGFLGLEFTWVREFSALAVLTVAGVLAIRRSAGLSAPLRLLGVITFSMVVRYGLFPVFDDRALIVWYAAIALLVVALFGQVIHRDRGSVV